MPRIIEEQTVDGLNLRKLTVSLQNWGKRQCQCTNTSRVGEAPWLLWHASVSDGVALVRCGVAVINARKKQARGGNVGLGCLALRFVSSALNLWWHRTPWQPPGQSGAAPLTLWCPGCRDKRRKRENHAGAIRHVPFSILFLRGQQPRDISSPYILSRKYPHRHTQEHALGIKLAISLVNLTPGINYLGYMLQFSFFHFPYRVDDSVMFGGCTESVWLTGLDFSYCSMLSW